MQSEIGKELWIGLAGVVPGQDSSTLGPRRAAYVNAIALAVDRQAFIRRVDEAVQALGLSFEDIDNVDRFEKRRAERFVAAELIEAAKQAEQSGEVIFGTFHSYDWSGH